MSTPPQLVPPQVEGDKPSGFLGGFMGVAGPHLHAQEQEELNNRAIMRDIWQKRLQDPSLAVHPDDENAPSPNPQFKGSAAEYKRALLKNAQDEYLKVAPKQAKGILQQIMPLAQHILGHKKHPGLDAIGIPSGPPSASTSATPQTPQVQATTPAASVSSSSAAPSFGVPIPAESSSISAQMGPPSPQIQASAAPAPAPMMGPPSPTQSGALPPADYSSLSDAHAMAMKARAEQESAAAPMNARVKEFVEGPHAAEYAQNPMLMSTVAGHPNYAMMNKTVGKGEGYAGELRKEGYPVPDNIPDTQYVKLQEMGSGKQTFAPTAAPGEKAIPGGKLATGTEIQQGKEARSLAQWQQKNKVTFSQAMVKMGAALQNSLAKGDYAAAGKIVRTSQGMYDDSIDRMKTMDRNLVAAKAGDQQAALSLVANHIGMTLGAQKGARITRAVWEEAIQSTPWIDHVASKFFHNDPKTGDKVFDGWKGGVTLTPEQMDQMVQLGHEKVDVIKEHVQRDRTTYQEALAARAGAKAPPSVSSPSPAPTSKKDPLGLR